MQLNGFHYFASELSGGRAGDSPGSYPPPLAAVPEVQKHPSLPFSR